MHTEALARIADEACGVACGAGDEATRAYAAGVEDLARLLTETDPQISARLVSILHGAGARFAVPASARPVVGLSIAAYEDHEGACGPFDRWGRCTRCGQ